MLTDPERQKYVVMPFAKGAKATPTYFRARSGALCFRRTVDE
jgi:hypothetical protein